MFVLAKIVVHNALRIYAERIEIVGNGLDKHWRAAEVIFTVFGCIVVLKIGVANAINGKSLIIFHALSIGNRVLAVKREVEMEIGIFLLQLLEVFKEECFTQSACSIEEVELAVACMERFCHVHDLSAKRSHTGTTTNPNHLLA